MKKPFLMDDYGYESYESIDNAITSFAANIECEMGCVDLQLDLEHGLESGGCDLIFQGIATEDVKETVKNMASKAKSNIVLWTKKLINFFFGWIINYLKNGASIRSSLKKYYEKAKKYQKALNEMSSKIDDSKGDSGDKLEVRDYGTAVSIGLGMILMTSCALKHLGPNLGVLTEKLGSANAEANSTNGNENARHKNAYKAAVLLDGFNAELFVVLAAIGSMDFENKEFRAKLSGLNFNIEELFNKIIGPKWSNPEEFIQANKKDELGQDSKYISESISEFHNSCMSQAFMLKSKIFNLLRGDKNAKESDQSEYNKDAMIEIRKHRDEFKKRMEFSKKNASMEGIQSKEMIYRDAWMVMKKQMSDFINYCENNKGLWNFEKFVKPTEKVRRVLMKTVDNLAGVEDESKTNQLLADVITLGNFFSDITKCATDINKQLNRIIDAQITDIAKLGSKVISITNK